MPKTKSAPSNRGSSRKKTEQKVAAAPEKPRVLKRKQHRFFRFGKSTEQQVRHLPSSAQITRQSANLLWLHKKIFGGILLIYAALQLILVQGILGTNFSETSDAVKEVFGNSWHGLASGFTSFSLLVSSAGQANTAESSVYQTILLLLVSLAVIWALRQIVAGRIIRIRDAYYKGMYPLVPFLIVLAVISLQTIPLLVGAWLYQTVIGNGIATSLIEQIFWLLVLLLLATASLYMICSSLFALYIVTLPEMTPVKALRSASGLVSHSRLSVFRKLVFLTIIILLALVCIVLPVILVAAPAAPYVFYIYTVLMVGFVHSYLYSLYRELLLNE
jgi:hypothetical protein